MDISKAHWASHNGRVSLSMPINKVDAATRTISGFASLDNLDSQGDIVTAEAAMNAFERFRGNIREMHQPIAVGKVVSFDQRPLYDATTDKTYVGVYVTAYISTGAQDTWEKLLDGTLTGFSIGGAVIDSEDIYDTETEKMVCVIKAMELMELSVVDSPANELANILALHKSVDSEITATGIAVDVETENVYWCGTDKLATLSKSETSPLCFSCEKTMENIGWIESNADKAEKMQKTVQTYISKMKTSGKGGVDMTEETNESVEKSAEEVTEQVEEVVSEAVEEPVAEESTEAPVDEVVEEDGAEEVPDPVADGVPAVDATQLLQDFKTELLAAIGEITVEVTKAATASVDAAIAKATETYDSKIESLESTVTTLKGELTTAVENFGGVAKRIDAVESATAIKKSGDLDRDPEMKKSLWAGAFLSADQL